MLRLLRRRAGRGAGGALQGPEQLREGIPAGWPRSWPQTEPNGAIWANQFDNVANREGHYRDAPAPRSGQQTGGKVDGFICAVGTGGTLAGVGMALKERNPEVRIGCADPMGAALYSWYTARRAEGRGHLDHRGHRPGPDHRQPRGRADRRRLQIPDEEALPIIFDLVRQEGLCLGGSSGINIAGAIRMARELGPGHTHRHHPLRLRHALPEQAVQPRLPAGARACRCRPGWPEASGASMAEAARLHRMAGRASGRARRPGRRRHLVPAAAARDARAEYAAAHIPGAVFFDIDDIADDAEPLPHMLPSPGQVRAPGAQAGPGRRRHGSSSMTTSASSRRRGPGGCSACSGHQDVAVLDGGLAKWRAEGRAGRGPAGRGRSSATSPPARTTCCVRDLDQMRANLTQRREQVVDARSARAVPRRGAGAARRACAAATSRAAATCPMAN